MMELIVFSFKWLVTSYTYQASFSFFSNNWIQTWVAGVEGALADQWTTMTTANPINSLSAQVLYDWLQNSRGLWAFLDSARNGSKVLDVAVNKITVSAHPFLTSTPNDDCFSLKLNQTLSIPRSSVSMISSPVPLGTNTKSWNKATWMSKGH